MNLPLEILRTSVLTFLLLQIGCRQQSSSGGDTALHSNGASSVQSEQLKELNGTWLFPCKVDEEKIFMEQTSLFISEGDAVVTKVSYNNLLKCEGEVFWEKNSPAIFSFEGRSSVEGAFNISVWYQGASITPKSQIGLTSLQEKEKEKENEEEKDLPKTWKLHEATQVTSKDKKPGLDIYKIVEGKLCFGELEYTPQLNRYKRPTKLEPLIDCATKK